MITSSSIYFLSEVTVIKPHGKLVKVNERNMHIRQMGNGNKTIVLLPGWGMLLPSVEFAPLMRELSKKYTVCSVEFFGYGHSDNTDIPRTNENYTQEIRESLFAVGLKPPYVLMPYSASGIYAEYYAAKYPNEIEGLILLDCYSSAENTESMTNEELNEFVVSYNTTKLTDDEFVEFINEYLPNGYTEKETREIFTMGNHVDTLREQYIALPANIEEVMSMNVQLGKSIPILMFNSEFSELDEEDITQDYIVGLEKYIKHHLDKLCGVKKQIIIKGSNHFDIYNNGEYRQLICKEISAFLD
jgi:pimeloyl-ACP methyl ester carboxylesterase